VLFLSICFKGLSTVLLSWASENFMKKDHFAFGQDPYRSPPKTSSERLTGNKENVDVSLACA